MAVVRRTRLLSLEDGQMRRRKQESGLERERRRSAERRRRRRHAGGGTFREDTRLLGLSASDGSLKKGCRVGGAVSGVLGGATPLVSMCRPGFSP